MSARATDRGGLRGRGAAALLSLLALSLLADGQDGEVAIAPPLELQTARDASGAEVRVGAFEVHENRVLGAGRKLSLDIIVLPATGPDPEPDPIVVLAGGPGLAATRGYQNLLEWPLREKRDVVLVDQRGTGGAHELDCSLVDPAGGLQGYLDPLFDIERFRDCLEELQARADLRMYSTATAMDDLDDVRAALGYERINLIAGSYGTRAALVYMRRHPETVRTAILNGVAPIAFTNPLYHAEEAQDALDRIIAACAADPACAAAYPDLDHQFDTVLERLAERPAHVTMTNPRTGARQEVDLTRAGFTGAFRIFMYGNSRDVPWLIHRAFEGDLAIFAERTVERVQALTEMIAFGMLLCVTCAEDVDRIDPDDIARLTERTFMGGGRVRAQIEICSIWPRSELPDDFGDPVAVDTPVLLLSGSFDPVTSARWGAEAARHLPSGLHVVAPGSHGVGGPCIDSLIATVIERGSTEGIDTSCVETMNLGPFTLPE